MAKGKRLGWAGALAVQGLACTLLTLGLVLGALALPAPASGVAYTASMWAIIPLLGGLSAYLATRGGLNNFAAWIAPPVLQTLVHWVVLGYPPQSAGMPVLAALCALVCAAAGDVINRREEGKQKDAKR